jgi:hypothetical protein
VACQRLHRQLLCDSSFAGDSLRARDPCSLYAMEWFSRILGSITPANSLLGEQQLLRVPVVSHPCCCTTCCGQQTS